MAKYKSFGAQVAFNSVTYSDVVSITPLMLESDVVDITNHQDGVPSFSSVSYDLPGDNITYAGGEHQFGEDQRILVTNTLADPPDPLVDGGVYYAGIVNESTFYLKLTAGGAKIDLTDVGTGTTTYGPFDKSFRQFLKTLRDAKEITVEFNYDESTHDDFQTAYDNGTQAGLAIVQSESTNTALNSAIITKLQYQFGEIDGVDKLLVTFKSVSSSISWVV